MQLFMCNKSLMMNVGLNEIKKMKPEEMYIFLGEMNNIAKEIGNQKYGI